VSTMAAPSNNDERLRTTSISTGVAAEHRHKLQALTGRHVTVSRVISFLISLGLCGVGLFLVLLPWQVLNTLQPQEQSLSFSPRPKWDCGSAGTNNVNASSAWSLPGDDSIDVSVSSSNVDYARDSGNVSHIDTTNDSAGDCFGNGTSHNDDNSHRSYDDPALWLQVTQFRLLGGVLTAFGIATALLLLQFTAHEGIRLFHQGSANVDVTSNSIILNEGRTRAPSNHRSDGHGRVSSTLSTGSGSIRQLGRSSSKVYEQTTAGRAMHSRDSFDQAGLYNQEQEVPQMQNQQLIELELTTQTQTMIWERSGEMSKCRCALVSHAVLGLMVVFVGLLFHNNDSNNNGSGSNVDPTPTPSSPNVTFLSEDSLPLLANPPEKRRSLFDASPASDDGDYGDPSSLLIMWALSGGCLIMALASVGLMASFWPILIPKRKRRKDSKKRRGSAHSVGNENDDFDPNDYFDCDSNSCDGSDIDTADFASVDSEMEIMLQQYKRVRWLEWNSNNNDRHRRGLWSSDMNGGAFSPPTQDDGAVPSSRDARPNHKRRLVKDNKASSCWSKWCSGFSLPKKKRSIFDIEQVVALIAHNQQRALSDLDQEGNGTGTGTMDPALTVPFLQDALLQEDEEDNFIYSNGNIDGASSRVHRPEGGDAEAGTPDVAQDPSKKDNTQDFGEKDDEDLVSLVESRITGIRRLLQLVAPQKPILYIACVVLLLRLPFSLSMPHFVSTIFGALARFDYVAARKEIFIFAIVGTIDAALDFWCVWLFGLANLRIVKSLRLDTFSSLLRQEVSFFDEHKSGELTSRLTADCGQMASELTWVFRFSIEALVRITGIATYMLWRSPLLASGTLCLVPIIALANKFYGAFLERNAKATQEALAQANSVAQETLSCIRTVIAFATETVEHKKYYSKIDRGYRLNVRELFARSVYYMVICTFLVKTVVQSSILLMGVMLIQRGQLSVEVLLAFMLYQGQLQEYTLQLFQSYTSLLRSSGAGDKVFLLLDRIPPSPGTGSRESVALRPSSSSSLGGGRFSSSNNGPGDGGADLELSLDEAHDVKSAHQSIHNYGSNSIEFVNVEFTYPTRPQHQVLKGISLNIPSGHTVALVGSSGCGKSTMVNLVERFYDPTSGIIRVGGHDLCQIPLSHHRQRVGIVTQDPVLFSGTILSNILYGSSSRTGRASLDDAIEAARLANAHDFIETFEQGYFTQVGERGLQLSGGQKQRIAIARAILKQPSILLLDEATSALDTESERLVQEALDRLLYGTTNSSGNCNAKGTYDTDVRSRATTTIVVAHRLQTVRNADTIAVISNGSVVEQGNHATLISLPNGQYKQMVDCADFET
jgi:ABC-type multidrug transport system fused ATPase/permease subunit